MDSRMRLQRVDEANRTPFAEIRSWVYRGGEPVPAGDNLLPEGVDGFLAYEDDVAVGAYSLLNLETLVRGRPMKTAGYAAVAVPPEHRGGGVGQRMMSASLRPAREEGYLLASLYAFREPFYRKSGFASMGTRLSLNAPTHRMPSYSQELPAVRLSPQDWRLLEPCYESFAAVRSGLNRRSEWLWQRKMGSESSGGHRLAFGDPVEAYLLIDPETAFWAKVEVSEFVWSTARGYRSAMASLRHLAINQSSVEWSEPGDSPTLMHAQDHGIKVESDRPIMVRVLDVVAGLQRLAPETSGRFTLAIDDPDIPENRGPFEVQFEPGGVHVGPASTGEVALSIGEFSQAFFGEPSLEELLRFRGSSWSEGVASACRLLSPRRCFCLDFF